VDEVEANIVVLLAGYFGAVRAVCPAAQARRSAHDDDKQIANLLEKVSKTRTVFQQEATQLVKREWNAIEAVARELLAHRSLDADEIEIIADSTLSEEARTQRLAAYRFGMRPP
jgi:predicted  nucleic acid-binding Zn ribbon protein